MKDPARATRYDATDAPGSHRMPWHGSVRVLLLLLGALGLQRWLLCAGGALIIIGLFLEPPAKYALGVLGFVLALVPLVFVSGTMMRYLVSPRGLQLVPRAREQMLGGLMLTTGVIATAITVTAWGAGLPADWIGVLWLRVATVASIMLLSQFILATSVPGMMLWFMAITGSVMVFQIPLLRAIIVAVGSSTWLLVAITLGCWIAFSLWFLRAGSFKSPNEIAIRGTRTVKVRASHAAAIRAWLFGNPSLAYQFSGGLVGVLLVSGVWTLLAFVNKAAHSFADVVAQLIALASMLGIYAGVGGFMVAQRSKFLWLRGGVDRMGLFRLCERQAWRFFGATAISLLVLLAIAWLSNPDRGAAHLIVMLLQMSMGVCLLYIGLMHVTGWRVFDVVCTTALTLFMILTFPVLANVMKRPWLLPELFGGLAAFAFILRLVAVSRWERIDWLVCRPPKLTARGLPAET